MKETIKEMNNKMLKKGNLDQEKAVKAVLYGEKVR